MAEMATFSVCRFRWSRNKNNWTSICKIVMIAVIFAKIEHTKTILISLRSILEALIRSQIARQIFVVRF